MKVFPNFLLSERSRRFCARLGVEPHFGVCRRRDSKRKGWRWQNWVPCGRHVSEGNGMPHTCFGALPCHKLTF